MANSDCYQYIFKEVQCSPEIMERFNTQDSIFQFEDSSVVRWEKERLWNELWEIVEKAAQENLTENQRQYWELAKKGYTTQRISAVISTMATQKYQLIDEDILQYQKGMTKSGYIPAGVKYGNYIRCQLCGKMLSQIHVNHLKKYHHDELGFGGYKNKRDIPTKDILEAYREKFPDAPIYTKKKNDELGIVTQQGLWDRKRNALKKLRKILLEDDRINVLLRKIMTVEPPEESIYEGL